MGNINSIMTLVAPFLPFIATLVLCMGILWGVYWFLIGRYPERGNEQKFPVQLVMLLLSLIAVLALVMTLPLSEESRSDVMRLIGIVLSGIIAFSSTNIIANLMAGVLLRIMKPFSTGDFIRVGEFFGRVSQRGLFDTEIQSETRELIAIPNAYLIKNPISATPSTGAIVSASLSLGYDVPHSKIETLLIQAAEKSGLEHAFVHILELGNFSVTYRISGLLNEVKGLITARSNLFRSVLEVLHEEGIEIVSPTFMNQRKIGDNEKIIPTFTAPTSPKTEGVEAEKIVFDKAEQSEQKEKEQEQLIEDIKNLELQSKEAKDEEKERVKENIETKRQRLKELKEREKNAE
ncbi:mechanosensitive ion channel domain-containing protein [Sulfurospirillum sp. 1612]|uniref:mechanosensitive ion channel domain-containing protein n=1 Tax=Sulfurospirillum sp. 1612 TaxID=3094835 RepID=UPI002F95596F